MMSALADRIEALEGPSREVDWAIEKLVRPRPIATPDRPLPQDPAYTTSLDAAMTLGDGLTEAELWTVWNDALTSVSCAGGDLREDVARYWSAAALRAKEAQDG